MLWIEEGHRVVIDAPVADTAAVAAARPDNDNVPYSAACLEYLNVPAEPAPRLQVVASVAAPAPCPANDRAPYSPSCIAFMMGATETGMRWRNGRPGVHTRAAIGWWKGAIGAVEIAPSARYT